MSNEFDADKMLEEMKSMNSGETISDPTLMRLGIEYKPSDGTIIDPTCDCSGDDCVDEGGCVRTFNVIVTDTTRQLVIHEERFAWFLPDCYSCLNTEASSSRVIKKLDSTWCVELKLCTSASCSNILELPLSSVGMPISKTQFKVAVELLPIDAADVLATAEREGLAANAMTFPADTDYVIAAEGLKLTDQDLDELGLE